MYRRVGTKRLSLSLSRRRRRRRRNRCRCSSGGRVDLLVRVIFTFNVLDHLSTKDSGLGMDTNSENTLFISGLDWTRGQDVVAEEDLAFKQTVSTLVVDPLSGPAAGLVATHDEERSTTAVLGGDDGKLWADLGVSNEDGDVGRRLLDDLDGNVLGRDTRNLEFDDHCGGALSHAEQGLERRKLLVL